MDARELKKGEIVQLSPTETKNKAFAGCLAVVDEPKAFGAQIYIQGLGQTRDESGGVAYYRARWEEMEPVFASAYWVLS